MYELLERKFTAYNLRVTIYVVLAVSVTVTMFHVVSHIIESEYQSTCSEYRPRVRWTLTRIKNNGE